MTEALYGQAVGWLDRNVSHILPDDGSYGIDHILEKARQVVRRKGVRILVIDPMNRLEQRLEPGQTEMDYITDTLNKLGRFATRNQCLVILVAHPRKVNRNEKDGTRRRVEMNDINGSANFANICFEYTRKGEVKSFRQFGFHSDKNANKKTIQYFFRALRKSW